MGLLDAAKTAASEKPRRKCDLAKLMETLDDDQRQDLQALLTDKDRYSAPVIAEALASEGLLLNGRPVNRQSIARHRNGACCGGSR